MKKVMKKWSQSQFKKRSLPSRMQFWLSTVRKRRRLMSRIYATWTKLEKPSLVLYNLNYPQTLNSLLPGRMSYVPQKLKKPQFSSQTIRKTSLTENRGRTLTITNNCRSTQTKTAVISLVQVVNRGSPQSSRIQVQGHPLLHQILLSNIGKEPNTPFFRQTEELMRCIAE